MYIKSSLSLLHMYILVDLVKVYEHVKGKYLAQGKRELTGIALGGSLATAACVRHCIG